MKNMKNIKIVVLVLVLIFLNSSVVFTYSSYKTQKKGSLSLKGATWNVNSTGNKESITLTAGQTDQTYTLQVTNGSEVDVKYTIVLSNIPTGVQVKLDNGSLVTPTNNTVTFDQKELKYSASTSSASHTITFHAPIDIDEASKTVSVKVNFIQSIN